MYFVPQRVGAVSGVKKMTGISGNSISTPVLMGLIAALFAATWVFEISELSIAFLGAGLYQLIRMLTRPAQKSLVKQKPDPEVDTAHVQSGPRRYRPDRVPRAEVKIPAAKPKTEYRQVSVAPILAPTFQSTGFDAEVAELLVQIAPTADIDAAVQKVVRIVKQAIWPLIPDAEVTGFAHGNFTRCQAFGKAIPEVDVVISATPAALMRSLQTRLTKGGLMAVRSDARKLQKSAMRACTDELVTLGGLKFRRSAFRGEDPKVTLLAPAALAGTDTAMPLDVSVNSATPLHNAALLTECGHLEPRAKGLMMLVKRWARDRGIAFAAKGHLSPYGWSLLSIYFLQVGASSEGCLLPPLTHFERLSGLAGAKKPSLKWTPQHHSNTSKLSVAALFKELVHFYHTQFDWRNEAVSARLGERSTPGLSLPLHIVDGADSSSTMVAPAIEDPFDVKRNIATCMTAFGISRLLEELSRAEGMLSREVSLVDLLEPWAPPECDLPVGGEEEVEAIVGVFP